MARWRPALKSLELRTRITGEIARPLTIHEKQWVAALEPPKLLVDLELTAEPELDMSVAVGPEGGKEGEEEAARFYSLLPYMDV